MNELIYCLNISNDPKFKAAARLMTEIIPVSRLKYVPDLIKCKNICPMPKIPTEFNASFSDVCLERAAQLWSDYQSNNQLNINWSGGIDSTTALVALLKTRPSDSNIRVFCNLNSINEHSEFYKILLQNKNVILVNSSIYKSNEIIHVISGEFGDQIFGSDLIYRINVQQGFESLFEDYKIIIPKLFKSRAGEIEGAFLYDRYEPIVNESPFPIKTAFDFVWWWNFTQKWQFVKFRQESFLNQKYKVLHFFESENFQIWSIFRHHEKIGNNLNSYKMPAKDFIFSYDGNSFYRDQKKKFSSPVGNKLYYYAKTENGTKYETWSECNDLIEKNRLI